MGHDRHGKRLIARAVLWAAAMAAVICAWLPVARAESGLVRFTYTSGLDALPAIVGIERGYFAREGLTVSATRVADPGAAMASVASGSSDFALMPQRALLRLTARMAGDFKIVAMGSWGAEMELVVAAEDTTSMDIAGFKGKRVGVGADSEAFAVLIRMLDQARMRHRDVTIVELPAAELAQALSDGRIDGVLEGREITSVITARKLGRVVMDGDAVTRAIGRIGAVPLIANGAVVAARRTTVQSFINGWGRALAHIRQDPGDAAVLLRILMHRRGATLPVASARSWIAMRRYDRLAWTESAIADANYNAWGLFTGGKIRAQPRIGGYVDNEFAEKADRRRVSGRAASSGAP